MIHYDLPLFLLVVAVYQMEDSLNDGRVGVHNHRLWLAELLKLLQDLMNGELCKLTREGGIVLF